MGKWNLIIYAPAYNVEKTIPELIERTAAVAKELEKNGVLLHSFIVVNDGSTDGTLLALRIFQKKYPFVEIINKERNEGATAALFDGMKRALELAKEKNLPPRQTILVRMDTDLEHQPEDLERVLSPLIEGGVSAAAGYIPFDYRSGIAIKWFNEIIGKEESKKFLGLEIPQFCPGFNAFRLDLASRILPILEDLSNKFLEENKMEMLTIDFVILAKAKKGGAGISIIKLRPVEDKWIKRPSLNKIGRYYDYHAKTVKFLNEN